MTDKRPEIRLEYMDLDALVEAPRNPKKHDIDNIKASMRRFGFTAPPGINETTGKLVAGHGRREALLEMKAACEDAPGRIKVKGNKWLVPVLRGIAFAKDEEAEAYMLADNRLAELGGYDEVTLVKILSDLNKMADGLIGTGYQPADIDALVAFQSTGGNEGEGDLPDLPDYDAPAQQPRVIIICKTKEQVAKLWKHLGLTGAEGTVTFQFEEITRDLGE